MKLVPGKTKQTKKQQTVNIRTMVIGRLVSSRCIAQQSVLVSKETTNRAKADSMAEASEFTIITRRVNRKRTSILHDCASSERAGGNHLRTARQCSYVSNTFSHGRFSRRFADGICAESVDIGNGSAPVATADAFDLGQPSHR